jgi:prepilin-type N-terminal cleavage/methylation domain-containing protein
MRRSAFTLIEILVVLAIATLLTGMVVSVTRNQSKGPVVQLAAEQVAAMLRTARALAISDRTAYTVSFNIQNARGTSSRVINNRDGGHWCRIIRSSSYDTTDKPPLLMGTGWPNWGGKPDSSSAGGIAGSPHTLQDCDGTSFPANGGWPNHLASGISFPTFAHAVEEIRENWVSEKLSLPAGRVRFLALGDSDEGPRVRWDPGVGYTYGDFYPRPYFGFYDSATRRLYPWGGHDPSLPAVKSYGGVLPDADMYSGLFYQGFKDTDPAPLAQCTNPDDRIFKVDWNGDKVISGADESRGTEDEWVLLRKGEVRPLVNGEWGDFTIVFNRNGEATFPAMKCNRRYYTWDNGKSTARYLLWGGCGPSDLAKNWSSYADNDNNIYTVPNGESINYSRHTNGAFITLAPDSPDGRDDFPTAADALKSLMPMYRVFVSATGIIEVVKVRWNDGVLQEAIAAGGTPWPSDPATFKDAAYLEDNFRYGWLHATGYPASKKFYGDFIPRGRPITDQVSPEMMARRIWWIDGVSP